MQQGEGGDKRGEGRLWSQREPKDQEFARTDQYGCLPHVDISPSRSFCSLPLPCSFEFCVTSRFSLSSFRTSLYLISVLLSFSRQCVYREINGFDSSELYIFPAARLLQIILALLYCITQ